MRVAMDANALMLPVEVGVRVFEELDDLLGSYEAVVPSAVVAELEKLGGEGSAGGDGSEGGDGSRAGAGHGSGGEAATAASVGVDLADRCEEVETDASYADDALYELATGGLVDAVVTNDGPLRERLLDAGVPVIHLRGRNQLTITRP